MTLIFVLNVGRSGSRSVATHYGLEHEPDGENPIARGVDERRMGKLIYGETSHWWKAHLATLNNAFPDAEWIHLVRNGRDVVRSFYSRGYYTDEPKSDAARQVLPPHSPYMPAFDRCCYYWRYWNEQIEEWNVDRVKLESLKDIPRLHKSDKLREWSPTMEKVFMMICGEMMKRYGYE